MSWAKRMNLASDYIEANLHGQITIEDVAKEAYCSKYYFHRVFFSYCNLTVSDYVRKRKFTFVKKIQNCFTVDYEIKRVILEYHLSYEYFYY